MYGVYYTILLDTGIPIAKKFLADSVDEEFHNTVDSVRAYKIPPLIFMYVLLDYRVLIQRLKHYNSALGMRIVLYKQGDLIGFHI